MDTTFEELKCNVRAIKCNNSEVQQVILKTLKWTTLIDSHLSCLAVSNLVQCGLLSVELGLSTLQQKFLLLDNEPVQRVILSEYLILLWGQLKARDYRCDRIPWPRHPLHILEGRENLTEDVVIAFVENPDQRISNICADYLKPLLFNVFKTCKNVHLLSSLWKYLLSCEGNEISGIPMQILLILNYKEDATMYLDLLHYALGKTSSPELMDSCLLLLATNLQFVQGDLSKYLNKISQFVDTKLTSQSQILYPLARLSSEVPVGNLEALMTLIVKLSRSAVYPSITWNMVLDSTIQWVSKPPPFVTATTYKAFEQILTLAKEEGPHKMALPERHLLSHFSSEVTKSHVYQRLFIILETEPELTTTLINNWKQIPVEDFSSEDLTTVRAMILSPRFSEYLKDLLDVLKRLSKRHDISSFITPFLYKMAQETDPQCQLHLLKFLPEFAENKENIPIILSTVRKLDKNAGLDLICLELYYNLWRVDHRLYSYLFEHLNYLQGRWKNAIETQLAVITTISRICQTEASQHFPDLVKLIADIMNGDLANHFNGVIMAIALDAIRILCEKRIINIVSTWNAIKGKFKDENRKSVKIRLYKLFGVVPSLSTSSVEFEAFEDDILSSLWTDLMDEEDQQLIEGILLALKNFPFNSFKLVRFPEIFRVNVQLPKSHLANETEEEYILNFPYIPGECWIQMLEKVPEPILKSIHILICPLIAQEVKSFRGVFNLPEGKQEPKTLTGVHPKSILKAILDFLVVETRNGFPNTELVCAAIIKCLAVGFSRPLPFDWSFLEKQYEKSLEVREDCLKIFCHHVEISPSAQKFLKNYLVELDLKSRNIEEVMIVMKNFHKISPKLSINEAEIFLRNTLEYYGGSSNFKTIFNALRVNDLDKDLKTIVDDVVSQMDPAQLADEVTDPEIKRLLIELDELLRTTATSDPQDPKSITTAEVRAFLRTYRHQKPSEKMYWLQEVASKLKLCEGENDLNFYGGLLMSLIVKFSKLSAIGLFTKHPIDDWTDYDMFAQLLNEQTSFNLTDGSLSQVFRCIWTRVRSDNSVMAEQLKDGLRWIEEYKMELLMEEM